MAYNPETDDQTFINMSDLEFEMLIRKRVKHLMDKILACNPQFEARHSSCEFRWSMEDISLWYVSLGETYSKTFSSKGEVLSQTIYDAENQFYRQKANKVSLLLAPPESSNDDPEDFFK